MRTWLFTWNPKLFDWDVEEPIAEIASHGAYHYSWNCGRSTQIAVGDRFFLLRQGVEPRGIVASGFVTRKPRPGRHWNRRLRPRKARFVNAAFDAILDSALGETLPIAELQRGPLAGIHWGTQASGIEIDSSLAPRLERVWRRRLERSGLSPLPLDDAASASHLFPEAALRNRTTKAPSRNPKARAACIEHYTARCSICQFDFNEFYGESSWSLIHVHHLKPMSQSRGERLVDPKRDLRPVCPNCHAVLHLDGKTRSIEELQRALRRHRARRR